MSDYFTRRNGRASAFKTWHYWRGQQNNNYSFTSSSVSENLVLADRPKFVVKQKMEGGILRSSCSWDWKWNHSCSPRWMNRKAPALLWDNVPQVAIRWTMSILSNCFGYSINGIRNIIWYNSWQNHNIGDLVKVKEHWKENWNKVVLHHDLEAFMPTQTAVRRFEAGRWTIKRWVCKCGSVWEQTLHCVRSLLQGNAFFPPDGDITTVGRLRSFSWRRNTYKAGFNQWSGTRKPSGPITQLREAPDKWTCECYFRPKTIKRNHHESKYHQKDSIGRPISCQ